jgi:hypothetical protein
MHRPIIGVIALAWTIAGGNSAAADEPAENPAATKAAVAVAEKWLSLVDEGQYAASWETAAAYFRNAIRQDQWDQAARAVRQPLGDLVSRKLKSTDVKTSLPGAPDGQYVVIQFETAFQFKQAAVETVTPMRQEDGTWAVSGYFIK